MMNSKILDIGVTIRGRDIWVMVCREYAGQEKLRFRNYNLFDWQADHARRNRFMCRAQRAQAALFERGA